MKEDYTDRLWKRKYVSEPDEDWFISKIFKSKKQIIPINEQRKIIETKKFYFGEYIP